MSNTLKLVLTDHWFEEIKKEPRFRYCQEIGCPDCYNCKQKLEVFSACGGYGLDYFCRKAGKVVYRD